MIVSARCIGTNFVVVVGGVTIFYCIRLETVVAEVVEVFAVRTFAVPISTKNYIYFKMNAVGKNDEFDVNYIFLNILKT